MMERGLRGGAWDYNPRSLRSAERGWFVPGLRIDNSGFRVAVRDRGKVHVLRGGPWLVNESTGRSACWGNSSRGGFNRIGFRIAVRP